MDDAYILLIMIHELEHVVTALEEYQERWRVMIFPWISLNSIMEFCLVDISIAKIDNQIRIRMSLIKELCHLFDAVSVQLLCSTGSWKAHAEDPLRDVSNIKVILIIHESITMTADFVL